jgi:hypothetical protein
MFFRDVFLLLRNQSLRDQTFGEIGTIDRKAIDSKN